MRDGGGHCSHETDVILRAGVVQEPGTQLIPRAGIGTHASEAKSFPTLFKGQVPPSLLRLAPAPLPLRGSGSRCQGSQWEGLGNGSVLLNLDARPRSRPPSILIDPRVWRCAMDRPKVRTPGS